MSSHSGARQANACPCPAPHRPVQAATWVARWGCATPAAAACLGGTATASGGNMQPKCGACACHCSWQDCPWQAAAACPALRLLLPLACCSG